MGHGKPGQVETEVEARARAKVKLVRSGVGWSRAGGVGLTHPTLVEVRPPLSSTLLPLIKLLLIHNQTNDDQAQHQPAPDLTSRVDMLVRGCTGWPDGRMVGCRVDQWQSRCMGGSRELPSTNRSVHGRIQVGLVKTRRVRSGHWRM